MQHLRTVDEIRQVGAGETFSIVPNGKSDSSESKERAVQLPSSVFASNEEAAVGLLDRGMVYGMCQDYVVSFSTFLCAERIIQFFYFVKAFKMLCLLYTY